MNTAVSIFITIIGMISVFTISKWNRWLYKYNDILNVPLNYGKATIIYWLIPIVLFFITFFIGELHFILLLFAYGIPMGMGQIVVKKQYIKKMTKWLMENENKTFEEAKVQATFIETTLKY